MSLGTNVDSPTTPSTATTVTALGKRTDALPPPPPQALLAALGATTIAIDWLAGDGSDRCYYRLQLPERNARYVLMQLSGSDSAALQNGEYDWIRICHILREAGVKVPTLQAELPEHAALIIEDYGNVMFEASAKLALNEGRAADVGKLYDHAMDLIVAFLSIKRQASHVWCQRAFDAEKLSWELHFFQKHFMDGMTTIRFSPGETAAFAADVAAISEYLGSFAKWFVHRDFHSRNIMVTGEELGVIDFQDARLGPAAYDVVSLAFDSYVPLRLDERVRLIQHAVEKLRDKGNAIAALEVAETWKPVLLQRQLKALGSFGYLTNVKNRPQYRQNVAPAVQTMPRALLYDARWPFLSGDLLDKLAQL